MKPTLRNCIFCNKIFGGGGIHLKKKFCSWKCLVESGHQSKIMKGRIPKNLPQLLAIDRRGDKNPMSNPETVKKATLKKKGYVSPLRGRIRLDMRGENNPLWKGGIAPINNQIRGSLEYKIWERFVKNRDGYCCQKCGENRVAKLTVHHIKNFAQYPKLRFLTDNGITFCRDCHKEFHGIFGKKDNSKKQIGVFIFETFKNEVKDFIKRKAGKSEEKR